MGYRNTFGALTGPISTTKLDENFADLADKVDTGRGASLVGCDVRRAYGAGSVGHQLNALWVNVTSFRAGVEGGEAKGNWNGTTGQDDTTAIRNAVAFAELVTNFATYGSHSPGIGYPPVLFFPDGNYKVSDDITVTKPLHIQGVKSAERSSGSRIVQTVNDKAIWKIVPQAQGMSFTMDRMALNGNGVAGSGHLVDIQRGGSGSYCNSQRYTDCEFSNPSGQSLKLIGDDIVVDGCLFDVSGASGGAIQLGTNTAGDVATNVRILRCNFFNCTVRTLLVYNANDVLYALNEVTQPSTSAFTQYVVDALNSDPVLCKGLSVIANNIRGGRSVLAVKNGQNIAFNSNNCYDCGIGSGETLPGVSMGGTVVGFTMVGNTMSGTYDTSHFYSDAAATAVQKALIADNNFINQGGTGRALNCAKTTGRILPNNFDGFTSPSVSERFTTTGNAFNPGTVNSLAANTVNRTVTDALVGDKVEFRAAGGAWPLPPGIVLDGLVTATNTATARYSNPSAGGIAITAHDLVCEVTR